MKFQEEEYKNVQLKLRQWASWNEIEEQVGAAAYWSVLIRLGISLKERETYSIKTELGQEEQEVLFL